MKKIILKERIKKAFYLGLGSGLIIVGLVSLLFPIIPGAVLILLGSLCLVQGSEKLNEYSIIKKLVVSTTKFKN
jgi:uncharacterized protein YqgC (DUF456 family)